MTNLESFAKAALQGQLANPVAIQACLDAGLTNEECIAELVRLSVVAANALSAELARSGGA